MFKHLFACLLLSASLPLSAQTISSQKQDHIALNEDVFQIEPLADTSVEAYLLSATAGDPAVNGLYLSLAIKSGSQWNVYFLKDINRYEILPSAQTSYLKLRLHTDSLDEHSHVVSKPSILFVNMTHADRPNGRVDIEEVQSTPF